MFALVTVTNSALQNDGPNRLAEQAFVPQLHIRHSYLSDEISVVGFFVVFQTHGNLHETRRSYATTRNTMR